jgi:hypothetical protein
MEDESTKVKNLNPSLSIFDDTRSTWSTVITSSTPAKKKDTTTTHSFDVSTNTTTWKISPNTLRKEELTSKFI